jgi:hypothetical protein
VEGTGRGIVGAENTVIYRGMAHGTGSCQTLGVELKPVSPHHLIGKPGAVDRRDKLNILFFYL